MRLATDSWLTFNLRYYFEVIAFNVTSGFKWLFDVDSSLTV
jgi:hypothetical protein